MPTAPATRVVTGLGAQVSNPVLARGLKMLFVIKLPIKPFCCFSTSFLKSIEVSLFHIEEVSSSATVPLDLPVPVRAKKVTFFIRPVERVLPSPPLPINLINSLVALKSPLATRDNSFFTLLGSL